MGREMLDTWAANIDERRSIISFWDWLTENDPDMADSVDIETALDSYHEIDQAQLDRERRELLDTHNGTDEGRGLPRPSPSDCSAGGDS